MLKKVLLALVLLCSAHLAFGQVATATYAYGTFDNKGLDTINLGNLNVHLSIPIINKAGRGLPFSYSLGYDSSVWHPSGVNGTGAWTPLPTFGWTGITPAMTGYITYTTLQRRCYMETQWVTYYVETSWVYHDALGQAHAYSGVIQDGTAGCATEDFGFTATATDASGYTMTASYDDASISTSNGSQINAPLTGSAGTIVDANGNTLSADGAGHFTDTTGKTVLSVTGVAPSPTTLKYTDTSGNLQTVTMNYKSYTVQTKFNCTATEYGPTPVSLIDNITFPDGIAYHFAYEATPGVPGNVTGRLASVTLPQGGVISYTYSGSNNGIVCADGGAAGLTRSLAASNGSAASTWTYARTPGTGTSHTEITDGLGNHSNYDFVTPINQSNTYETNRANYQGAESGTPLVLRQTCYNGSASPCKMTAVTLPISQIDTYETLNGGLEHGATAKYNTYGLQTEQDTYDFGTTSARGGLLRKEAWVYPSTGIVSLLSSDTVTDGGGNQISQTTYAYDETTGSGHAALVATSGLPQHGGAIGTQRGNLTTVTQWNNLGSALTTTSTYEDTGNPLTTTTPNGKSSYVYDSATHAFLNTSTPPTPSSGVALPSSATSDPGTGLPLTATDANSAQIKYASYDALLRPLEIDGLDSSGNMAAKTTFTYSSPNVQYSQIYHNASTSGYNYTDYDAYGRTDRLAVNNGQASNPWYQQDGCFDANGNLAFQSYSYQGAGFSQAKVCSGSVDTYAYDALGRVQQVTHSDGTLITYTYIGRASEIADENGVTRISQVDGLGRIASVCEVSSVSLQGMSPGSCGQDIAATGFLTRYSYTTNANSNQVTTVSAVNSSGQVTQSRTFTTDSLGRTVSVTEPERGTTTYSYAYSATAGFGLTVTRQRPQANQSNAGVLTTATMYYDAIGRLAGISYNDNLTQAKAFAYDAPLGWGSFSQANLKGRLSGAWTTTSPVLSATAFSYDAMGRTNEMGVCILVSGCGGFPSYLQLANTYDWTGNILTTSNGAGVTATYTYSVANEVQSIASSLSDATHPNPLVTSVNNGPNGPISYALGNGLGVSRTYDGLGRYNGQWVCVGAPSVDCSAIKYGFAVYSRRGAQVLGVSDNVTGQFTTYGYDNFNRLQSANYGNGSQTYNYVYDRYGNRWQQNAPQGGNSFSASFDPATNRINSSGYTYDAAGNMTNDSFHTYTYDAEGNILQVDGGSTAKYTYDAMNQRVRVVQGSANTVFIFNSSGQKVAVGNALVQGGTIEGNFYWGNQPIAYYTTSPSQIQFEHQDWLGTERARTSYNGAMEGTFWSWPFGDGFAVVSGTDSDANHFAALNQDDEDWTEHAQFRNYSPAQGRWLSPDPYDGSYDPTNPQSFNRYAYVLNNPLSFIDPSGLDIQCYTTNFYVDGSLDSSEVDCYDIENAPNSDKGKYIPRKRLVSRKIIKAPSKGTCRVGSTPSHSQYASAFGSVAAMTAQFFSGLGPTNNTFGSGSAVSQVMAQSPGVQDAINGYNLFGKTSGGYNFGVSGAFAAGNNIVAQFVGGYSYSISSASGGINLSLSNYTSFRSLAADIGPSWARPAPMGTTHQTYNIFIPCP
jgi:RHS repeat-associated protein